MKYSNRRVHRLRINTEDEDGLSADINALQDAFNIASLPGIPLRGLLLIKKLDLGSYPSASTSLGISKLIDKQVREIDFHKACVDEVDYPQQDVVWFGDVAQAVFSLVNTILRSGSAEAWYWTRIFPSWRPGMNLAQTLVAVAEDYPERQSKPMVFAQLIERLLSQSKPRAVLDAVSIEFARQQLKETGLYPYLVTSTNGNARCSLNLVPNIHYRWRALLQDAVSAWGEQDLRSLWIAHSALILQNPAIVGSDLVQRLITSLIKRNSAETRDTDCMHHANPVEMTRENRCARNSLDSINAAVEDQPGPSLTDKPETSELFGLPEKAYDTPGQNNFAASVHSDTCGLAFIISLLELLSVKDLLSKNPVLAALNLPVSIVSAIACRFGVPDIQPILQSLPELATVDNDRIETFNCPPGWQTLINTTGQMKILYRCKVKGTTCYITDRTKKLLLYVGNKDLPQWMSAYQIIDQTDNHVYPGLRDLQTTIQLLASRYLYRYAKISLRSLVHKRGQIALSNTHLDILFDSSQIDIRIRIAGLDIDPGWVPWYAHVVHFHYIDGGHGDA